MSEPFHPTHLLTVRWPDRVQIVALRIESSDGYGFAYTAEEWAKDDSAAWERSGDGWLLDGWPVMDAHPDRPAARSLQVQRLHGGMPSPPAR